VHFSWLALWVNSKLGRQSFFSFFFFFFFFFFFL
jgi:hypothetical protein